MIRVRSKYLARARPPRRLGAIVCVSAVLLLTLQSLGQLTLRDVLTVAGIVSIAYVYTGRLSSGLIKHNG
jgi:hypothetical protein